MKFEFKVLFSFFFLIFKFLAGDFHWLVQFSSLLFAVHFSPDLQVHLEDGALRNVPIKFLPLSFKTILRMVL